ncbi:MAG: hypothetical protein JO250_19220 [Armatimonadetes bacterium]|nr:hypothetical protein [Armatimonadota bacterium]
MLNRANIAAFLQGLVVLPLSSMLGLMVALLFRSYYHWSAAHDRWFIGFCVLFPLAGAVKTRQGALLAGLLAGLAVTVLAYFALRPRP